MQFSTTTLTLFLTALASLSTTQARIGQTPSADDNRVMVEETTTAGNFQPTKDDMLKDIASHLECFDDGCTIEIHYGWMRFTPDIDSRVSVNDHRLEDDTTAASMMLEETAGNFQPTKDDMLKDIASHLECFDAGCTIEIHYGWMRFTPDIDSQVSVNDRRLEDDITAASGTSPYTVFIVVSDKYLQIRTQVGLLDENKRPISRNDVGGDVTCVQVGDGVIPDDVHYFIGQPDMRGFIPGNANCAKIGNSNNAECDLLNLPKNACVIVV